MIIGIDIAIHFHPDSQKTSFLIWIDGQPPQSECEVHKNKTYHLKTPLSHRTVWLVVFGYTLEVSQQKPRKNDG